MTYGEEHEKLLVVLANTVVDPGAVVVHLLHTPPTHTASRKKTQH